jgi:hypothetical protein
MNLAGGSPIGQSFQACFAVAQTNACIVNNFMAVGGYSFGINLDIQNGILRLAAAGAGLAPTNPYNIDIATGLSFATGNLYTGTRYRLYFRVISSTQLDIYLASAPFNSSTWTTMYSNTAYTLPSGGSINYALVENFGIPYFGITTSENVNKTVYVDWIALERDIAR